MPSNLNEILGPTLGFLFTTVTLLFIAFFAHKTARPVAPATEPEAPGAADNQNQEATQP